MNRSFVKNPIDTIVERATQMSRDASAPVRTSGANGFGGAGGIGNLVDSGAVNGGGGEEDGGAFTIPAINADGEVYTQNVLYWGLDSWGESLWG